MTKRWLTGCAVVVAMVASLSGCTTTEHIAGREDMSLAGGPDPLIVARIDGMALLTWQSQRDKEYTVLYADGRRVGAEWRALEGASRIRGTGQEIRWEDRMPQGQTRYYRLMVITPDR